MTLRRTPVYVEGVDGEHVYCTPSGVDLPPGSGNLVLGDFPPAIRGDVRRGQVFFAWVNLSARRAEELGIERIEDRWGDTGPLHFDAAPMGDEQRS